MRKTGRGPLTNPFQTTLAFDEAEYRRRVTAVANRLADAHLDALYVTSPPNLYYLTNYESIWYDIQNPSGALISADGQILLLDSQDHETQTQATTVADEWVSYPYTNYPDASAVADVCVAIASELRARGLMKGRLGIERWSWAPSAPTMNQLTSSFQNSGAQVEDASFLVDSVRFIKSGPELEFTRKAAQIADETMTRVLDSVAPGRTELEVAGEIYRLMSEQGGEEPAIRVMVHSGARSGHFHGPSTSKPLERNEPIYIDFCASYRRYHADVCRMVVIGECPREVEEVVSRAVGCLDSVRETIRPADPLARVQNLADEYIDNMDLRDLVWWIGGYALGIALPPDWVGHIYWSPAETLEEREFGIGAVTTFEILFESPKRDWGAGYIDTVTMTESGLEPLSKLPREVTIVA